MFARRKPTQLRHETIGSNEHGVGNQRSEGKERVVARRGTGLLPSEAKWVPYVDLISRLSGGRESDASYHPCNAALYSFIGKPFCIAVVYGAVRFDLEGCEDRAHQLWVASQPGLIAGAYRRCLQTHVAPDHVLV